MTVAVVILACALLILLPPATGADCFSAPANPQDRRENTAQLRLGTFNVEWLFEGNDQSPRNVTYADIHLLEVAKAIAALNLDIIALQEVKNCEILVRLITAIENEGAFGYKHYLKKGTDTATGQNVALITRVDPVSDLQRTETRVAYPIPGNKCGTTSASGTSAVSKHFWADFVINDVQYRFFNFHFLAYPTDPARCVQREAQASVIRQLINDALNNYKEIIVFGDYNDYSDVYPDVENNIPTSRVMQILRDGLVGESAVNGSDVNANANANANANVKSKSSSTLVEVSANIPQHDRYSCAWDVTKLSQIDHLLVTDQTIHRLKSTEIAHIYPRETVSDHWPFILTIST